MAGGRILLFYDADCRICSFLQRWVHRLPPPPPAPSIPHLPSPARAPLPAPAGAGTHVDRHEHIGRGEIGKEPFRWLVNDPRFADVPGLLETPGDDRAFKRNLKVLRSLRGA